MPLQTDDIRTILESGGLIRFASEGVTPGTALIETGIVDQIVDNNYKKLKLTVSTAGNSITLTRVPNDSADNNAVDVLTVDAKATVGTVNTPGYIYTGNFSGCVFYLYRSQLGEISGVHAYNGSQPVTTGKLMWKKTKQVVREFGPQDYFLRNPARMICRYPTRGEMDLSTGEQSLSFLSCVENTTATTFLFSVRGSAEGYRIQRLIRTYHVGIVG